MTNLFIPSYHRPHNLKTVKLFLSLGWKPELITVFVDNEADDIEEYRAECNLAGVNLVVFDMKEARERFDYVHRPSISRRSAGQARNMFQDYAKSKGLDFYVVQDDDSTHFEIKKFGSYQKQAEGKTVIKIFDAVEEFMRKRKIGVFGMTQTGDYIGGAGFTKYYLRKVMNTTFYFVPYVYRGERGVQDNDTSQFVGILNEGLFTGSAADGLVLGQMDSATQEGGLTDNYKENKLLNKSLVTVIQFPSAIRASKQIKNGGRLHHLINYRYLAPKILRIPGGNDNIAWDTFPEDYPFTNEPKRLK